MTNQITTGILVLIDLISQRKLSEFIVKLTKTIQKFHHKYDYYPQYIQEVNDYCLQSITTIKKHILMNYYPKNILYKITNLNQAHSYITKVFDDMIKRNTNINNMILYDGEFYSNL